MTSDALKIRFAIRQGDFTLQADLDLPGRGVTALFGHSGAGKTTLLRAIAGLDRHRNALVRVGGEVWQDDEKGVFVPVHRRALGYVFQEASLLPHLTVRGNLLFGWKRAGATQTQPDMDHLLDLLGIGHLLERYPNKLSGGERQRVAVARALLAKPKLLLMDEPLASLDLARKREVLPYLERLHAELSLPVLYVSHSADEVARLADHVVLLDAGRVLASGSVAEIAARIDLPSVFGDDAGAVIAGVVESYDAHYGLAQLRAGSVVIRVAHRPLPVGTHLRLRIPARDVSLTLTAQQDGSALNQLPARVVSEADAGAAHVLLRLDADGMPLLARITRQSRDRLQLVPGNQVWAQFKAVVVFAAD